MCWGCVMGPFVASMLGSTAFTLPAHHSRQVKLVSIVSSISLTVLTTFGLKSVFGISFCGDRFTWQRAIAILGISGAAGIIYNLGINFLIVKWYNVKPKSCCSRKNQ